MKASFVLSHRNMRARGSITQSIAVRTAGRLAAGAFAETLGCHQGLDEKFKQARAFHALILLSTIMASDPGRDQRMRQVQDRQPRRANIGPSSVPVIRVCLEGDESRRELYLTGAAKMIGVGSEQRLSSSHDGGRW
jgi:hypothetical protein